MSKETIQKYLEVIKKAVSLIEAEMALDDTTPAVPAPSVESSGNQPALAEVAQRTKEIQKIMSYSDWPEAVPSYLINAVTPADQINRANSVLDSTISESLENKHFLDYGCGEGWIAKMATKRGPASVTGYDIVASDTWKDDSGKAIFTTDKSQLKEQSYDVIMLYDVLDHSENPMELTDHLLLLLKDNGVIYIRCHPWVCRHGAHLQKKGLNKAFIHLFLSWEELRSIGYPPMYTRSEKMPLDAYNWWLDKFHKLKERIYREPVHSFFQQPEIKQLLFKNLLLSGKDEAKLFSNMEIQFVDYVVGKKK